MKPPPTEVPQAEELVGGGEGGRRAQEPRPLAARARQAEEQQEEARAEDREVRADQRAEAEQDGEPPRGAGRRAGVPSGDGDEAPERAAQPGEGEPRLEPGA